MRFTKKAAFGLVCSALIFGAAASTFAVEMSLAGIKLGRPAADVLKKYGNPTRVTVGTASVGYTTPGQNQPGGIPAPGQAPGGYSPLAPLTPVMNAYNNYANEASGGGTPGSLPTLPGLGYPGAPGMPGGMPGAPGAPGAQPSDSVVEEEVTWTYDLSDGTTLEFLISQTGRIIQITVGGDRPYTGSRTAKGIKLGSSYKDVIFKYGYPEGHQHVGRFLRASYADKQRCVFTFLGKRLVGITIALKSE